MAKEVTSVTTCLRTQSGGIVTDIVTKDMEVPDTWTILGDEVKRINIMSSENIALWIRGSVKGAGAIQVRVRLFRSSEDPVGYLSTIQEIGPRSIMLNPEIYDIYEIDAADFSYVFPMGISDLCPYMQLEVRGMKATGSEGSLPAVIHSASVSFDPKEE